MSAVTVGILIVSLIASVTLWALVLQSERELKKLDRRTKKLEDLVSVLMQPKPAAGAYRSDARNYGIDERPDPPPITMPGPGRERLG